jgi:hypothetical protein
VYIVLNVIGFILCAYWAATRSKATLRTVVAYCIALPGLIIFVSGFAIGVREDARGRYGRVVTGVVTHKYNWTYPAETAAPATPQANPSQPRPILATRGSGFYDLLPYVMLTPSPYTWVVDYRFPCTPQADCLGHDFVPHALWARIQPGGTVSVRQAEDESITSRLDDNPQWLVAFVDMGLGGALLLVAGVVSGRVEVLRHRRRWITAPAVVMAVEPVQYRDVVRWKVRFSYFDPEGAPQESADEVVTNVWKPGDDCLAVFQQGQPDLATMRPLPALPAGAASR